MIEYNFLNDLNKIYNSSINYDINSTQHTEMLSAYNNLVEFITGMQNWRETALQLSKLHGEAELDAELLAIELESLLNKIGGIFWENSGESSPALINHKNRFIK